VTGGALVGGNRMQDTPDQLSVRQQELEIERARIAVEFAIWFRGNPHGRGDRLGRNFGLGHAQRIHDLQDRDVGPRCNRCDSTNRNCCFWISIAVGAAPYRRQISGNTIFN